MPFIVNVEPKQDRLEVVKEIIKEQLTLRGFGKGEEKRPLPTLRKVNKGIAFNLPDDLPEKDVDYYLGVLAANLEVFIANALSVKEKLTASVVGAKKSQEKDLIKA